MKRNNLLRLAIVVGLIIWSLYEAGVLGYVGIGSHLPRDRDIVQYFRSRAVAQDTNFVAIVTRAEELRRQFPDRGFANLKDAVGTNDLTKYFPFFGAKNELYPTTFILNRLQREAAGKIKLGIDLQGGTSYLVEMDTNKLVTTEIVTNST